MKQSNFSLADVLSVLTALAFGFICFLGKNFLTLGNTSESIAWGVIIVVSLTSLAFIAKLLKRTSHIKTNFILEIIILILFTGIMFYFSYSPFPHYFTVSDKKTEIQNKLQKNITEAENMFHTYEKYVKSRKTRYEIALKAAVLGGDPNQLAKYGFVNWIPYDTQIIHKISNLDKDLLPPKNYSDTINNKGLKEVAESWLNYAKGASNNWEGIGIVTVVTEIEKKSTDWSNQLKAYSKVREKGESDFNFDYPLTFDDVKEYFITPSSPKILSIGLATVAYLLMLLSWLVTKRHTRRTGTLKKAPYEVAL